MGTEVLPVDRSSQFNLMVEPETAYGTYITPTETVTWGREILGANFLGRPQIRDVPMGFSQPIGIDYGPRRPDFPFNFWTQGGNFWNFLLGADFTGTTDEDIDGTAVGSTCFKHRIPDIQPFRPESFSAELGRKSTPNTVYQILGAILNTATINITQETFWEVNCRCLANNVIKQNIAPQTPVIEYAERIAGWHTQLKINDVGVLGFDSIRVNVNNTLKHSGDLTGTRLSSDLKRDTGGFVASVEAVFEMTTDEYIEAALDRESVADVEVRVEVGDTIERKMKLVFNDCYIEAPDFNVRSGDTEVLQNLRLHPIANSNGSLWVNRSFLTTGVLDVW